MCGQGRLLRGFGRVLLGAAVAASTFGIAVDTAPRAVAQVAPQDYEVIDLGTLGGVSAAPTDLSDSGLVTGWADSADGIRRPFLWSATDDMVELPSSGPVQFDFGAAGLALNDRGQVLGQDAVGEMLLWQPDGTFVDLGPGLYPTGDVLVTADLTEGGIAMWSVQSKGGAGSVIWSSDHGRVPFVVGTETGCLLGGITDAGMGYGSGTGPWGAFDCLAGSDGTVRVLPLDAFLYPFRLDDTGAYVGATPSPPGNWSRLASGDLATADVRPVDPGPQAHFTIARCPSIDHLAVTGSDDGFPTSLTTAYSWDVGTAQVTALPDLGGVSSTAVACNASGSIVGTGQAADGSWHGILWGPDGAPLDLDALVGTPFTPVDINADGSIVGVTTTGPPESQVRRAVLLRAPQAPAPEAVAPAAVTPAFTG